MRFSFFQDSKESVKLEEVKGKIHDFTNRIEWIQRELKASNVPPEGQKRRMTFYWNGFFDPGKEMVASPKITQKKAKKQLHKSFFEFLGQNTNNKRQRVSHNNKKFPICVRMSSCN
jgi:hypothetical protein